MFAEALNQEAVIMSSTECVSAKQHLAGSNQTMILNTIDSIQHLDNITKLEHKEKENAIPNIDSVYTSVNISNALSLDKANKLVSEKPSNIKCDRSVISHSALVNQLTTTEDKTQAMKVDTAVLDVANVDVNPLESIGILQEIFSGKANFYKKSVVNTVTAMIKQKIASPVIVNETSTCNIPSNLSFSNPDLKKLTSKHPKSLSSINIKDTVLASETPSELKIHPNKEKYSSVEMEQSKLCLGITNTDDLLELPNELTIHEYNTDTLNMRTNENHLKVCTFFTELILENIKAIEQFDKMRAMTVTAIKHMAYRFSMNVLNSPMTVEDICTMQDENVK
jgi:hypothetical protein